MKRPDRRWVAVVASVGVHALVLFALLAARATVAVPPEPPVITVALVRVSARSPTPRQAAPAKAPMRVTRARPVAATSAIAATDAPSAGAGDVLSGAGLGSAVGADALPGGECDMARRLQAALRRDALVRAAVIARGVAREGSAILVWNGGWVASPGEDGKGLAAVREAIVWEVAFAPAACRAERVHGPVLFRVSDTRIAVGSGDWRWGDLVSSR